MNSKLSKNQPLWYVASTYPNCERKAEKKLEDLEITTFLPLQKVVRQWSDRKKKLEVPLFPNYIFVNLLPHERFIALKVRELVRFVPFEGKPAVIPQDIINSIKKVLNGEVNVSNGCFNRIGMKVTISRGQFAGAEGVLIRKNGRSRLIIQVRALSRELSVSVLACDVEMVTDEVLK